MANIPLSRTASLANYVKFVRGTVAAFDSLAKKDKDTLYFISKEKESTTGSLYLGEKLISGSGAVSLNQLTDVIIKNVKNNQVLVYDEKTSKWIPKDISEAINISIMVGATAEKNGSSGLVPAPTIEDKDLFLSGSGKWSKVSASSINFNEENFISNSAGSLELKGYNLAPVASTLFKTESGLKWEKAYTKTEIDSLLSGRPGLQRKVVESLDAIDKDAPDALNYLYMVKNGAGSVGNLYDEYIVIEENGLRKLEQLSAGVADVDLSNYVTTDTFNGLQSVVSNHISVFDNFSSQVGDLDQLLLTQNDEITNNNLVEQVNYLSDKLTWHEI